MGEMHILKLREGEEYIKLGQALKRLVLQILELMQRKSFSRDWF